MDLAPLIAFYESLTPDSITRFPEFYSTDAVFKDPFNEVRGVAAIQQIFTHMFRQIDAPRFVVTERLIDGQAAMLAWELHYRTRLLGRSQAQVIRGVTHLRLAPDGKVDFHRDYWDAAEELYMKLPLIGGLMRYLQRKLAA